MNTSTGNQTPSIYGSYSPPSPSNWLTVDPRTKSTQSLAPTLREGLDSRKRLLIVYIHGYQGNDQSFQHFPFHLHQYLKILLHSHAIHTKIYPRYKTYRSLQLARDNFSAWLAPHESENTNVILIGHSMGGLLAAEVAMMPNKNPYGSHPFKHRILGTICLDAPLLGLHPGIVVSGIASLFNSPKRDADQNGDGESIASRRPTSTASSSSSSISATPTSPTSQTSPPGHLGLDIISESISDFTMVREPKPDDPNFNPPYFNDVHFKQRPFRQRIARFVDKHSNEGLPGAVTEHLLSHLEYGGCLADFPALTSRYNRLRALEDVDDLKPPPNGRFPQRARIRFVNYYTSCTGRPKEPKDKTKAAVSRKKHGQTLSPSDPRLSVDTTTPSPQATPTISVEDHSDIEHPEPIEIIEPEPLEDLSPQLPIDINSFEMPKESHAWNLDDDEEEEEEDEDEDKITSNNIYNEDYDEKTGLPPIPDVPIAPQPVDTTQILDKDQRKQVEKETKKKQKAYEQLVKEREKVLKQRQKMMLKRQAQAQKEAEKQAKVEKKRLARQEAEELNRAKLASRIPKERKFCLQPRKVNGKLDKTWIKVDMGQVDEVSAHCGLFVPGAHYEELVCNVGARITGWVHDDMTKWDIINSSMEALSVADLD